MPNVTGAPFTGHSLQPSARRTRGKSPSHRPRQRSRSSRQRKRSPAHSCPLELYFKRCICTKMMNMSNMTKCRGTRGTAVSCRSCRRPSVYLVLHLFCYPFGASSFYPKCATPLLRMKNPGVTSTLPARAGANTLSPVTDSWGSNQFLSGAFVYMLLFFSPAPAYLWSFSQKTRAGASKPRGNVRMTVRFAYCAKKHVFEIRFSSFCGFVIAGRRPTRAPKKHEKGIRAPRRATQLPAG